MLACVRAAPGLEYKRAGLGVSEESSSSTMLFWLLLCLYALVAVRASAPAGPWDAFNFAPKSRTVYPTAVKVAHGEVRNANALVAKGAATLSGNGSWIALDFGVEVSLQDKVSRWFMSLKTLPGWRSRISQLRQGHVSVIHSPVIHGVAYVHQPSHVR